MVGADVSRGRVIDDKYQIIDLLGSGGMSNVWLARDERLGKLWAIKEIKPNTQGFRGEIFRQAIMDEAHLMKHLDHPAIPRVVDILDTGKTTFVVMDYVEGRALSAILRERDKPFAQEQVIAWGIQLCDVLDYLHTRGGGIVYRDMKPANVIVREDGSLRLIDFGIALDLGRANKAKAVRMVGTPGYAAPEQLPPPNGEGQSQSEDATALDGRADVYALGATLYSLVSGHVPQRLRKESGDVRVLFEMQPIRSWDARLSEGLEHILLRATQQDPHDRYQTVREMRYDLEHHQELTKEWRDAQRRKVSVVRRRGVGAVACALMGACCLVGGNAVARTTYEGIMREARAAPRVAGNGEVSAAERLASRAIELDPGAAEPYQLLLEVYEDDYVLADAEARRLQQTLGRARELEGNPAYAQLCFDVGVCYLSYYGVDQGGGSVGNVGLASARAAAPWFERAAKAHEASLSEGSASLLPADAHAAMTYGTIAGFFDEVSRAGMEGRAAQEVYRDFFETLAQSLGEQVQAPHASRNAEGMRARLCQMGAEVLSSPTYLSGLARAGIPKEEVEGLRERIQACLNDLSAFAASDEAQKVYGPLFAEVEEELDLVPGTLLAVYQNPVAQERERMEEGV